MRAFALDPVREVDHADERSFVDRDRGKTIHVGVNRYTFGNEAAPLVHVYADAPPSPDDLAEIERKLRSVA